MASQLPIAWSRLPPLPTIKDILKMYRLRALKQLSQNFLMDPRLCKKIVQSAGKMEGCYVIEIGPGPGNITRCILERNPAQVVVIEKDERFLPSLELLADASNNKMSIINGDVLQHSMHNIFPMSIRHEWSDKPPPVHIIGNLPFNVSTPLIIRLLRHMANKTGPFSYGRTRLTLTFQKEVAERMAAPIMSVERNRLSIMCQYLSRVEHKMTIPGGAFLPKPEVDVGVVRFTPFAEPRINLPFEMVERVVRCVFNYRQKFCKRGVQTLFPKIELAEEMLTRAEVNPDTRPYELSMEEVARLCYVYSAISNENPSIRTYDYRSKTNAIEENDDISSDLTIK